MCWPSALARTSKRTSQSRRCISPTLLFGWTRVTAWRGKRRSRRSNLLNRSGGDAWDEVRWLETELELAHAALAHSDPAQETEITKR
jgi:hypothetical protein